LKICVAGKKSEGDIRTEMFVLCILKVTVNSAKLREFHLFELFINKEVILQPSVDNWRWGQRNDRTWNPKHLVAVVAQLRRLLDEKGHS
jgi:hypothetical protein